MSDVGAGALGGGSVQGGGLGGAGTVGAGGIAPGSVGAQQLLGQSGTFIQNQSFTPTTINLKDPNVARFFQTMLRDAGYYTGPIDGIWGPASERANQEYLANDRQPKATTPQLPAIPGFGGVGGGGGGGYGMPTPILPNTNLSVDEAYPEFSSFVAIPEISNILRRGVSEGWTAERIQTEIRKTAWWQQTTPGQRAWLALEARDPAAAKQRVADQRNLIQLAARDYAVTMSDGTSEDLARKVLRGDLTAETLRMELANQAKSLWATNNPQLAAALDQGRTVRDFHTPYAELAAKELEVNPQSIDLMDGKWQVPLGVDDGKGNRVPMTLWEWQKKLRSDTTYGWDKTSGARQQAAQLAASVAEKFGAI